MHLASNADPSRERFKNWAAGIQSYVLAIAVLVGGLWTLYRFAAIDRRQVEKELFAQATIDIKIEAKQETLENGEQCVVSIVEIRNSGTRNVFLDYGGEPFSIRKLMFHAEDSPFYARMRHPSAFQVLRAGETVRTPFVMQVPASGIYEIKFEVPLSGIELTEHDKVASQAGAPARNGANMYWVGATVLNVRSDPKPRNGARSSVPILPGAYRSLSKPCGCRISRCHLREKQIGKSEVLV
jgi:hypothetical protein